MNMPKIKLSQLLQDMQAAGPNAPISAVQIYALTAHLLNLQNVLVSVMETVEEMQRVQNTSHQNTNDNFRGLLTICKRIGREVGIEIKDTNEEVAGSPYNTTTKH